MGKTLKEKKATYNFTIRASVFEEFAARVKNKSAWIEKQMDNDNFANSAIGSEIYRCGCGVEAARLAWRRWGWCCQNCNFQHSGADSKALELVK